MKCPICQQKMQEGGLIAHDVTICWAPLEQFQKSGAGKLAYFGVKPLKGVGGLGGAGDFALGQTRVPGAFYCAHCKKVVGMFDVEKTAEE